MYIHKYIHIYMYKYMYAHVNKYMYIHVHMICKHTHMCIYVLCYPLKVHILFDGFVLLMYVIRKYS
jgi:hypothetical protein